MPLDVDYPPERLQYMMDDAKIKMIVTQTKFVSLLQFDTAILNIDHQMKYINAQSNENLQNISCTGDSPAYINYTSGSTGKPKGVVVLHKGVIRLVHKTNYAQLDANQTFLQLASVSFDATTFELWGALLNGAKCVLFEDKFPTLNKLQECIQKNQISILFITTALFNLVIDEDPNIFKNITQILTGGEAHSVNHMYKAVTNLPNVKFTNVYGPTENTTFSTFYHIDNISSTDKTIPIGKPISNTFAYVLNEERIPVLTGEIGELYLGGVGLAQGYLYAPEITASKFIKNLPFLPADEHLYKTGDLVRMNSDDNLEFIGRIDNQVKINGFRVELEEIECHLKSFPNIKQAIVIASHKGLHNRLIAYVVADKKVALINEIKEYLRLRLPSYMIPTFIYNLDALPLTKNGKIDRKELEGMVA
jgi:amino acid adenylation domain-containing protein